MFTAKTWLQLGLALATLVIFSSRSSAETISCSSDDGNRHYCSVGSQGGVRLVKQNSKSPCQQGYSWGSDRQGIWVDHGCRAEFQTYEGHGGQGYHEGYNNHGQGDYHGGYQSEVISCSSDDMHRHYCPADTRGGVQLVKQRSDSSCRQGKSWGYDNRGIWVDKGCRADFQVGR